VMVHIWALQCITNNTVLGLLLFDTRCASEMLVLKESDDNLGKLIPADDNVQGGGA
jgi:hypothetical protein